MPETPKAIEPSVTDISLLETTFLASSPPDGTELQQANTVLKTVLNKGEALNSLTKRYIARATSALERMYTENTLLRKENTE